MPAFASYIVVDWSAASVPRRGRDSIWVAALARAGATLERVALANPATRAQAAEALAALIARRAALGRVLVGFDFPFGYPAGMAARLGLGAPAWRATWRHLADRVRDDARNGNNRFDLAEALNRALTGAAYPFWGNVREEMRAFLVRRGRRAPIAGDLAERRLCDARVPSAKTVWQLAGAGSVGSQVLLGLPMVWRLRHDPRLAGDAAIWPFETGLADAAGKRIILAEAYPSLVRPRTLAGKPKDAGQVVALAAHFARLDARDALAPLFAADPSLSVAERRRVIEEEAWILGVTGPTRPAH